MGTIARGTKAGSGTTDFATGTTALASEVNTDLNTIVNVINGGLDANNLADNAVTTAKITDSNVTTAKIADLGVTTGKINDLAVTVGKLAVGAAVNTSTNIAVTASIANFTTVETTIATAGSVTTRGGSVLLLSSGTLLASATGLGINAKVTMRWYRDSTKVQEVTYTFKTTDTTFVVPCPIPPAVVTTPAAGTYVYKVTAQADTTTISLTTPSVGFTGSLFVVELA